MKLFFVGIAVLFFSVICLGEDKIIEGISLVRNGETLEADVYHNPTTGLYYVREKGDGGSEKTLNTIYLSAVEVLRLKTLKRGYATENYCVVERGDTEKTNTVSIGYAKGPYLSVKSSGNELGVVVDTNRVTSDGKRVAPTVVFNPVSDWESGPNDKGGPRTEIKAFKRKMARNLLDGVDTDPDILFKKKFFLESNGSVFPVTFLGVQNGRALVILPEQETQMDNGAKSLKVTEIPFTLLRIGNGKPPPPDGSFPDLKNDPLVTNLAVSIPSEMVGERQRIVRKLRSKSEGLFETVCRRNARLVSATLKP